MKIVDFEIADSNLSKVTVVTEPRISQKVYDLARDLLKNLNFPTPALHAGRLVFPNAQLLTNQATMEALRLALSKAHKQVTEAHEREEAKKVRFLNQFRRAAGLPAKQETGSSPTPPPTKEGE